MTLQPPTQSNVRFFGGSSNDMLACLVCSDEAGTVTADVSPQIKHETPCNQPQGADTIVGGGK
jgi:hypothetical protein